METGKWETKWSVERSMNYKVVWWQSKAKATDTEETQHTIYPKPGYRGRWMQKLKDPLQLDNLTLHFLDQVYIFL